MQEFLKRLSTIIVLLALVIAFSIGFAQSSGNKGGDLVIAMNGNSEPATLDGQVDPYQPSWMIDTLVSDHLVFINPKTGAYEPFLATSWHESADGLSWTFTLRKGVKFQDGTPFNAEALKFNIERILNPKTKSALVAARLGPVSSVDVINDHKIRLNYKIPWNNALSVWRITPIWSPTSLKKYPAGEYGKHLVGTGPFKLEAWVPKNYVKFVRWDDYNWGPPIMNHSGPVYLHSVTFKFISEDLTRGTIIKTNQANMVWDLPVQYVSQYQNNPNYVVLKGFQSSNGIQYAMNTTEPPLNNIDVRKAILYAVNQEGLNKLVFKGLYRPNHGPLNNVNRCYLPSMDNAYPYDPKKAADLLEKAGWVDKNGDGIREAHGVKGVKDGTPLQILWVGLARQTLGEALQAQLKQVGIDLQLKIVPGPVQLQMAQDKTFGLMYERLKSPNPSMLYQLYDSENARPGGWAWTGFKSEKLDQVLQSLQSAPNVETACKFAKEAQQIVSDNALQLPVVSQAMFYALKSDVKGVTLGHMGNWFYLYNAYVGQ